MDISRIEGKHISKIEYNNNNEILNNFSGNQFALAISRVFRYISLKRLKFELKL